MNSIHVVTFYYVQLVDTKDLQLWIGKKHRMQRTKNKE